MQKFIEKADKLTIKQFEKLISEVEKILGKEKLKGKGKLENTIKEISQGEYKNENFRDDGIYYLGTKSKIIIIGDTHGDSKATVSIINQVRFFENLEKGNNNQILIFLGDFVDRGRESIRNLEIVFNLKLKYPENVILLRGNHEEGGGFVPYDLPYDLARAFGGIGGEILHDKLADLFEQFANLAVTANGLVMVHGGIPSQDIGGLKELIDNEGLFHQMRWNDPDERVVEREFGNRGGPDLCLFGEKSFKRFMETIGGKIMIRSHEYPESGFKKYFNDRLITIFSTGRGSEESGYGDRVSPKFLILDLGEDVNKVKDEWIKRVF